MATIPGASKPDDPQDWKAVRDWNRDYLTMPGTRDPARPECKNYAMPLFEPGKGHALEKMWAEQRATKRVVVKKKVAIEDMSILQNKAAFINKTTLKCQMARLQRHVEVGMTATEKDLELKRNKLRSLILQEETDLTREYIDNAQKRSEQIMQEKKRFAEEILASHEKERLEKAKEKLLELARENCEDLRTRKSVMMRLEAAQVQKQQICENLLKKDRERENDKFWIDIWKKLDDEKTRIEEEDESVRLTKFRESRDVLRKQMVGKALLKEEIKYIRQQEAEFIQKLSERIKDEEKKELEVKLREKEEYKKIMQEQLKDERELKARRKQEEADYDKFFADQLARAVLEEKMSIRDERAQERLESEYFRQQLKEVKAAKEAEEKEFEELRQLEVDKKLATVKKNLEITRASKEKLHREVMEMRAQQVLEKQKALEREKEAKETADAWSYYILNQTKGLDKNREDIVKEKERQFAEELTEQRTYGRIQGERRRKEEVDMMEDQRETQRAQDEQARTFKPCVGEPHPFCTTLWK